MFVKFVAIFGGCLYAPPARPLITTPIFLKMKGVEVVHMLRLLSFQFANVFEPAEARRKTPLNHSVFHLEE